MPRVIRLALAVAAVLILLAPELARWRVTTANPRLDFSLPNGWFYTQTNGAPAGTSSRGYSVTNADGVLFWDAFRFVGGVDGVGFPVSRRFSYQGFTTQVFQKAVFQWRPDLGNTVVFANILDVLGDMGRDDWLLTARSTPRRLPPSFDAGAASFQEIIRRRQALLDEHPAIRARYFAERDPIALFGLPTSRVVDNGSHFVMRFQRAVIQHYKEDTPWARRGMTLVANGGDLAKESGVFSADVLQPEEAPSGGGAPPAQPASAPPSASATGPRFPGVGYGMQVDSANLDDGIRLTRAAGFTWVKLQVRWYRHEPAKGRIDWAEIDRLVTSAAGLRLMLSVVGAPNWARPQNTDFNVPGPPANPNDYADFVTALLRRHPGRVHAIEVWNEPNVEYEWGGRGGRLSAAQYVALLRTAYTAIKRVDPSVVVVSAGLAPTGVNDGDIAIDDVVFLQQMYQAGLREVSDAIGAHPSGFNNPPDDWIDRRSVPTTSFKGHGSYYFRRFEEFRRVMVANGDSAKQIWLTEFGWASSPQPPAKFAYARDNTEEQQAQYLVRAFQIAREAGYIGPMFVWNLNFAKHAEPDDRWGKQAFAILDRLNQPRPAYRALAAMPKP
ncbi:MAG: hypothetical protein NZ518_02395 [Dehalococcoidia bacterium]|nr:hypothetical protein [Dehalococcoidia bacterium]